MATVRYTVIDGEVIAEKRNGVRRLYVPDPLGSTVALIDNTQAITDRLSYWPYGEEASRTGTTPTPLRFVGTQGYYWDRLNSIYVRARHFRPEVGRWMTGETLGPLSVPLPFGPLSPYAYSACRPMSHTDPSGRFPCSVCRYPCLSGSSFCTLCLLLCVPAAYVCHYECTYQGRSGTRCEYGCEPDQATTRNPYCRGCFTESSGVWPMCFPRRGRYLPPG